MSEQRKRGYIRTIKAQEIGEIKEKNREVKRRIGKLKRKNEWMVLLLCVTSNLQRV